MRKPLHRDDVAVLLLNIVKYAIFAENKYIKILYMKKKHYLYIIIKNNK